MVGEVAGDGGEDEYPKGIRGEQDRDPKLDILLRNAHPAGQSERKDGNDDGIEKDVLGSG